MEAVVILETVHLFSCGISTGELTPSMIILTEFFKCHFEFFILNPSKELFTQPSNSQDSIVNSPL